MFLCPAAGPVSRDAGPVLAPQAASDLGEERNPGGESLATSEAQARLAPGPVLIRVRSAADGKVISGVVVRLGGRYSVTSSDGTTVLDGVPAGEYSLVVDQDGWERLEQAVRILSGERKPIDLALAPVQAVKFEGEVGVEGGRPLVGARLALWPKEVRAAVQGRYEFLTDWSGKFSVSHIPPGKYRCEVSGAGCKTQTSDIEIGILPNARAFVLAPVTEASGLTVIAQDSATGRPIGGARIILAEAWPKGWMAAQNADASGVAVFNNLLIGSINWMDDKGAVALSRRQLTVRAEAEGYEASITPAAMEGGEELVVWLNPTAPSAEREPNDSAQAAQSIVTGAPISFRIARPGDNDFFKFRLPYPAFVRITVGPNNPLHTRLFVLKPDGGLISDRSVGPNQDNVTELQLIAGKYVIQVQHWGNSAASEIPMTLLVKQETAADPFEPNDSAAAARLIRPNEEARGSIFPRGDVDFFRFSMKRPGHVRMTIPPHGLHRRIFIRDDKGQVRADRYVQPQEILEAVAQLDPGDYTADVHHWGDSAASLEPYSLRLETVEDDDIDDPADDPKRFSAVRSIELNRLVASTISPVRDSDRFTVAVPAAGVLHARVIAPIHPRLYLRRPNGDVLTETYGDPGTARELAWHFNGPEVAVLDMHHWGDSAWSPHPYILSTWWEPGDELDALGRNDDFERASPLEPGGVMRGSINPVRDADVYRVEVDHPGFLHIQGRMPIHPRLWLYDAQRRQVGEFYGNPNTTLGMAPAVLRGEYFIVVRHWGDSASSPLPYAFETRLERADPQERAPLREDPVRPLKSGQAQPFKIEHAGDRDRFLFEMAEAGKFFLLFRSPIHPRVFVFDDRTGRQLVDRYGDPNTDFKVELEAKGPTRYLILVTHWGDSAWSMNSGYILADVEGRTMVGEDLVASADPFDPTLVTFELRELAGYAPAASCRVDADGDGNPDFELSPDAPKTHRYPGEGIYAATAFLDGLNGTASLSRTWAQAVGERERKGIFITVLYPGEGQVIDSDSPVRASAVSYSGSRITRLSVAVDGREVGVSYSGPHEMEIPWRELGAGRHTLAFTAVDSSGESATLRRTVRRSDYFDLQPRDGAVLSGNSVRVSWTGTSFGPARVRYRLRGQPEWQEETGENGVSRAVSLTGLEPGKAYEFQPLGGGDPGPVRTVTQVKGLAFGRPRYGANIQRDYDQRLPVSVRNHADKPLAVRLECGKPDDPLLLAGFVGQGSEGAPFNLNPGEEREFLLGISAQDVIKPVSSFPIRLASESGFADEAEVELKIKLPVVKLEWEAGGTAPSGLGQKYRLHNKGDGLTDLAVTASDGLQVAPLLSHAPFPAGGVLEFLVSPVLHEGFRAVAGRLTARAVGQESAAGVNISLPEGQSIFGVLLIPGEGLEARTSSAEALLLKARTMAGSFLNPGSVDWTRQDRGEDLDADGRLDRWTIEDAEEGILWVGDDSDGNGQIDFVHADLGSDGQFDYSAFKTETGWEPTNLVEAWLEMGFSLPWARNQYEKHDVDIVLNGVIVGRLEDVLPEGNYTFRIPPTALKMEAGEKNIVEVRSRHLRGGHYVINSDFRIKTRLTGSRVLVAASSEEEARKNVYASEGLSTEGPDYAVSSAEVRIEAPQGLNKGVEAIITVPVRNIGATRTPEVEVALLRSEPGGKGMELSRIRLRELPLIGAAGARIPWKVGAGIHQLKILVDPDTKAGDTNRLNNEAVVNVTVPGDDAKPVVKIIEPTGPTSKDTLLVLRVEAKDDSGISRVEARIDNGLAQPLWSAGPETYEGLCLLQPGDHTITAACLDSSGNLVEQEIKTSVQVEPPVISELTPAEGAVVDARRVKVAFRCGPDAVLAGLRVNGGPWQSVPLEGGLAKGEAALAFGVVRLEVMAASRRGAIRTISHSLRCMKQPGPEEIHAAPEVGAGSGRMDIDGLGTVDLFSSPNQILRPLTTPGHAGAISFPLVPQKTAGRATASFYSAALLSYLMALQDPPQKLADKASDHPIKVITWGGAYTGYDLWDNQEKLKKTDKDSFENIYYPDKTTVDKMKTRDIVYVQNHGGELWTTEPLSLKFGRIKIKDLNFPAKDTEGPSLVLNWGCQNGNDKFEKKDDKGKVTEILNLLESRAKGFGVSADSKTKVYIAPKINVGTLEDDFQEKFFEEFGKGDVTAEEAARRAYDVWRVGWGIGAPEFMSSAVPDKFEDAIGIMGNKDLTLNAIRQNLEERDKLAEKEKAGKEEPSGPGGPASGTAPVGGMVSTKQEQKDWYCTNRPQVRSEFPPPPWVKRGEPDHPTSRDYRDMVLKLIDVLKERGMDGQQLEEFMNLMTNRIWTDFPEELDKRARWEGRPGGLPDLKDKEAVDAWREKMAASFLAEYLRILASDSRDVIMVRMLKMSEKIKDFDRRAAELAARIAGEAVRERP